MTLKAYYIDNSEEAPIELLNELGVLHYPLDADNYDKEGKLDKICAERGYNYKDTVDSTNIPNLKEKLATFHEEHLHDDEEIRFFLKGSGYFDVKDDRENGGSRWIRMECKKGDMLILPAGIYHRFIPDDKLYFFVMRFFCGEPIWTPYNRALAATDQRPARGKYIERFLKGKVAQKRKQEQSNNETATKEARKD